MEFARAGRELSDANKIDIVKMLQEHMVNGMLARGAIGDVAARLNVHRDTVSKVWNAFLSGDMASKKTGCVGRKKIYTTDQVTEMVQELPQSQRTTMRDITEATGLSTGTLSRHLKSGTLQCRSSRLKPLLTENNRLERIALPAKPGASKNSTFWTCGT
ncbi:Aste57867_13522 [Aphanomyces stellatus]|uniref:Aste57867_13522 protein n=1 Tax=Aphanomyces stellatus TaxID=120398 RepID=A0A485L0J7_9STRA|nr:hypothetical protein As57867_013472 [Aphanomyces stellatus]VFT90360.1 Aste57867_13522 [Aphanomyces stellatus]